MILFQTKDGLSYTRNKWGGFTQLNPAPVAYGPDYAGKYDDAERSRKALELNKIRLAQVKKCGLVESVLDVGFANGSFLNYVQKKGFSGYGYDVPENTTVADWFMRVEDVASRSFSVVTFFDSLEHMPAPMSFVQLLRCKYIVCSLPNAPVNDVQAFGAWYHRRPHEHIHHFDEHALKQFFSEAGYECVDFGSWEDEVRQNPNNPIQPNIITGVFRRV